MRVQVQNEGLVRLFHSETVRLSALDAAQSWPVKGRTTNWLRLGHARSRDPASLLRHHCVERESAFKYVHMVVGRGESESGVYKCRRFQRLPGPPPNRMSCIISKRTDRRRKSRSNDCHGRVRTENSNSAESLRI
eukprot:1512543-Rhodomonas_salina.1